MNQPNDPWSNNKSSNKLPQNSHHPSAQNTDVSGMGRNMTIIATVIGIALATWFFAGVEERQINPNIEPESYSSSGSIMVELQRNRYGHYVTSGLLNDEPVVFLLDTGATDVAIPGELEKKLDLQRGRSHKTHTANGTGIAYATKIEYLQIGEIRLDNVRASIVPGMKGEQILLGMAALKQLEFRQKGNQLTLLQER